MLLRPGLGKLQLNLFRSDTLVPVVCVGTILDKQLRRTGHSRVGCHDRRLLPNTYYSRLRAWPTPNRANLRDPPKLYRICLSWES